MTVIGSSSFVEIRDPDGRDYVRERAVTGYQRPEPWLPLNLNLTSGDSVSDQHQRTTEESVQAVVSYVLTTDAGSSKSLAT